MSRMPIEDPVIKKNSSPMGGEDYSHPAYGDISASRVTGHMNLYGSEFHHQGFITIRIKHAKFTRSLSRDWHFADNEIVEVALSEAQWAHFVSSLNSGGTQCTINGLGRGTGYTPRLPDPPNRQEQFDSELKESMQRSQETLKGLIEKIKEMKISEKAKAELIREIDFAQSGISSSAKFVAESFSEHMEEQTEKAKCEVNAYVTAQVQRVGLEALRGDAPLMITGETPKVVINE